LTRDDLAMYKFLHVSEGQSTIARMMGSLILICDT
jgi:hypothetical protein